MSNATAEATARKAAQQAQRVLEAKLLHTKEALVALENRTEASRSVSPGGGCGNLGHLGKLLRHFPEQQILAGVAVVLGLLSVLGPNALIDFVFATMGSCFGGLMLGSGFSYFYEHLAQKGSSQLLWVDILEDLIHGNGSQAGYSVCAIWVLLGLARYVSGCTCRMVAWVPEVKLHATTGDVETPMGMGSSLQTPLMTDTPRKPVTYRGVPGQFPGPHELSPSPRPSNSGGSRDGADAYPQRAGAPEVTPRRYSPDGNMLSARSHDSATSAIVQRVIDTGAPGLRDGRPSPSSSVRSGGGARTLPKPQPSKSTGIIARLSKSLGVGEGPPGSSHNSGRPGGAGNGIRY